MVGKVGFQVVQILISPLPYLGLQILMGILHLGRDLIAHEYNSFNTKASQRSNNTDVWHLCETDRYFFFLWRFTADPSPFGKFTPPTKLECGETLRDLEPVYDLFRITSEFALPVAVTQTRLYKSSWWNRSRREGRHFFRESSRNPHVK